MLTLDFFATTAGTRVEAHERSGVFWIEADEGRTKAKIYLDPPHRKQIIGILARGLLNTDLLAAMHSIMDEVRRGGGRIEEIASKAIDEATA